MCRTNSPRARPTGTNLHTTPITYIRRVSQSRSNPRRIPPPPTNKIMRVPEDHALLSKPVRPKFSFSEIFWRNLTTLRIGFIVLFAAGAIFVDSVQNPDQMRLGCVSKPIGNL